MELQLIWHKPVKLKESRADSDYIYEIDLDRIPDEPGVYIFIRKYGVNQNALYIGKAKNLKSRLKQHLTNNVRLLRRIQNKESGSRAVAFGVFKPKPGQQVEKCISLIEKALIRHFISEGHNLLNISGVNITKHTLSSDKVYRKLLPHKILFE